MQSKNNLLVFFLFVICVVNINCDTKNDENLTRNPRTGRLGLLGYLSGFKAANAIRNEYLYGRPWRASIHVETHWPPYPYPHPYYPPHVYPPYPYPMNGFGPNQRPLPPPSYGGGGGGVGLTSGYFDVTENQAEGDNMVNSVIKPSTRLNKLELSPSKKNKLDDSEDIRETVNRTVRTVPVQDSFLENRKLTIISNVSNEVSLTDEIDKTSNVSVANNSTINVSITEEKEPTIEQSNASGITQTPPIIETTSETTTFLPFSKPNAGYIYYKNSRYNRANEIFITTDFPPDQTGIFKASRSDDFRNQIESVR